VFLLGVLVPGEREGALAALWSGDCDWFRAPSVELGKGEVRPGVILYWLAKYQFPPLRALIFWICRLNP